MTYRVESYELIEEPAGKPIYRPRGEFDDLSEAIAHAQRLVDEELREVAPSSESVPDLISRYMCWGDAIAIYGDATRTWSLFDYVDARAPYWFDQLGRKPAHQRP